MPKAAGALTARGAFVLLEFGAARPCKAAGLPYNSILHGSHRGRRGLAAGNPGDAGVAQLVEHDVANVVVVGSNPITRSLFFFALRRLLVSSRASAIPTEA